MPTFSEDELERTFRTNILAMFHTCKAALEHMQPGAAIINTASVQAGAAIAERHRRNLEHAALPHPGNRPTGVLTLSAGVAAAQPGETAAQVLRRADAALYRAKAEGRNQVAIDIAGSDRSRAAR